MIFKFIQKPIVIDCFLPEHMEHVNEMFPIVKTSKHIPQWWKNTPKSSFDWNNIRTKHTTKNCFGIIGTFTSGFIMPLWSDLAIKTSPSLANTRAVFSDARSKIDLHHNDQAPNFYDDHYFMKITNPWIMRVKADIKIALLDPFYMNNNTRPYKIPYGMYEPINNIFVANIFLFVPKKENNFIINSGTPMYHVLPITERPIKLNNHIVDGNEYLRLLAGYEGRTKSTFLDKLVKIRRDKLKEE